METENGSNNLNEKQLITETEKDFNPYVGPVPFNLEKRAYFFGRDKEAETLLSLVISERIVLFYAQSGAGKSSLLNAELIPRLREKEYQVLPIARVGGELPEDLKNAELENIYVFNALWCLIDDKKEYKSLTNVSLVDFVKKMRGENPEVQCWLILDQMEEILTTYPEYSAKRREFFVQLRELLDDDPLLSVIIAMREDHIAGLDNYASLLPGRLETRFRIEKLKYKEAIEAIECPPTIQKTNERGAAGKWRIFDPGVAEALVDDLRKIKASDGHSDISGEYVEPVQLQVVCYNMWKNLDAVKDQKTEDEDRKITFADREKYANVDQSLSKFYEDTVTFVAGETNVSEVQLRRWFGETLITSGIRSQVRRGGFKSGGLPNAAVDLFLKEHLIRVEPARGGMWYELSHDRLIEPIITSNTKWYETNLNTFQIQAKLWDQEGRPNSLLLTEEMMEEVEEWVNQSQDYLTPTEREFWNHCLKARENAAEKDKKRYRWYAFGATILALCALVASGVAFKSSWSESAANDRLVKANEELTKQQAALTGKQKDLDEKNTELAAETEKLTKVNEDLERETDNAKQQTELAQKQKEIAEQERRNALEQTKIADGLRARAEKATSEAEIARRKEEGLRKEADIEKAKAENLKALGELYNSVFSSMAKNDIINTKRLFKLILDQYDLIDDSDGPNVTQNDGRLSSYVALIDESTKVIESSNSDAKKLLEYRSNAYDYYRTAVNLIGKDPQNTSQVALIDEKMANLLFALAQKLNNRKNDEQTVFRVYSEAKQFYEKAPNSEKHIKVLIEMGKLSFKKSKSSGEYSEAVFYFNEAINIYNKSTTKPVAILEEIIDFYASQDDKKLTEKYSSQLTQLYKQLADSYRNENNKKQLVEMLIKAGEFYERSAFSGNEAENPYFKEAIDLLPENSSEKVEKISGIAELYEKQKKYLWAAKYFNDVGELFKKRGNQKQSVDAFIMAGKAFELSGNTKLVEENIYFRRAVDSYPESSPERAETIFEIAEFYEATNNEQKADEYFSRASDIYLRLGGLDKSVKGLMDVADKYEKDPERQNKYYASAINLINKEINSGNLNNALIQLIYVAESRKEPKQKTRFYDEVIGTDEDKLENLFIRVSSKDERSLILMRIGNAYLEAGDSAKALDLYYEEALQSYSDDDRVNKIWTLIDIGKSYFRSNYKEQRNYIAEAENHFKQAQELAYGNLEKTLTAIEICRVKYEGQTAQLEECFNSSVKISTDFSDKGAAFFKIAEYYFINSDPFTGAGNTSAKALDYFGKSHEAYLKAGKRFEAALALVKEGFLVYSKGDQSASEKAKLQEKITEAMSLPADDELRQKAKIMVEIGTNLVEKRLYEDWVEENKFDYLSEAIKIYKQFPDADVDDLARAYTGILHVYYSYSPGRHPLIDEAFNFYDNNIFKVSYLKDGFTADSTVCLAFYRNARSDEQTSKLYKRIAESLEQRVKLPLKSIDDRQKQARMYESLVFIHEDLKEDQKAKYSHWIALRLYEQTNNTQKVDSLESDIE